VKTGKSALIRVSKYVNTWLARQKITVIPATPPQSWHSIENECAKYFVEISFEIIYHISVVVEKLTSNM